MEKPTMKTCSKCGETKPETEFHKDAQKPDGLRPDCKACNIARVRVYAASHKTETTERVREWREANREQHNNWNRQWRAKHREEERERAARRMREKRTNEEYREKVNRQARQWRVAHREHFNNQSRIYGQNRIARKKVNGGSFTVEQWQELCNKFGNVCLACGEPGNLTIDHVIPVSKGGPNSIDNIQPLCQRCNLKKKDKTIDYRLAPTSRNSL